MTNYFFYLHPGAYVEDGYTDVWYVLPAIEATFPVRGFEEYKTGRLLLLGVLFILDLADIF